MAEDLESGPNGGHTASAAASAQQGGVRGDVPWDGGGVDRIQLIG